MTRFTAPRTGISIEKLAFLTYWRQRIAIFNLRGVARVIANRIPICTGDHFPVTFQRFTTIDMDQHRVPHQTCRPSRYPMHDGFLPFVSYSGPRS